MKFITIGSGMPIQAAKWSFPVRLSVFSRHRLNPRNQASDRLAEESKSGSSPDFFSVNLKAKTFKAQFKDLPLVLI